MKRSPTNGFITLDQARARATALFRDAAATPYVRGVRYYPTRSKHFVAIKSLDQSQFAEFAFWLFTLTPERAPQRWVGYGSNAATEVERLALNNMTGSHIDSILRLLRQLESRSFAPISMSAARAILNALSQRADPRDLTRPVIALVERMVSRFESYPIRRKDNRVVLCECRKLVEELKRRL